MDNYIVYTRKSTDTEDRQILSLESQKRDIIEKIITPHSIKPLLWLDESQSAKKPGRIKFNEMVRMIRAGKINRILTWHINRLARNSVDGGELTWFVQNKQIKIITPTKTYDENDIFILYVEFGMANQFSNDLSKSVKRGLNDKLLLGKAPIQAPIGYCNDMAKPKGLKDILVDWERFEKVRKMWDLLLTGQYTPALIYKIISKQWGLRHRGGKLLSRTQMYKLFHNIFYTGKYLYTGEIRQGIHTPMITMTEYEKAQKIIGLRGKMGAHKHHSTYTGMLKCPCSASITAEVKPRMICPTCHKKFNPQHNESCPQCTLLKTKMEVPLRIYTYYRCSRQIDKQCKQPPVTEKNFEDQVSKELVHIHIPDDFLEWGHKYLKDYVQKDVNQFAQLEESTKRQLTLEKQRKQNLFDRFIEPENKNGEMISSTDYKEKKGEITKRIAILEDQLQTSHNNLDYASDNTEKTLTFSHRAQYWFENGSRDQKRVILTTLDLNPTLDMGFLRLNLLKPFEYIKETKKEIQEEKWRIEPSIWREALIQRYYLRLENPFVSGIGESNPCRKIGNLSFCH